MDVRSDAEEQALLERLRSFIGRSAPSRVADDEVNRAMIRHWCEAIGDESPAYRGDGVPEHDGLIAPATMLGIWTMRGLQPLGDPSTDPRRACFLALEEAGYPSVVATNIEQEYERPLRLGDVITETRTIESVSERKTTALGEGYFVTELATFTDQHGEVVGRQRFRLFKFKPAARQPAPARAAAAADAPPRRPRPAMNQDTEFFWEGARNGELLVQRCTGCGTLRHPPRPMCAACRSLEWDAVAASGRGEVYSYVVYHHPPAPGFQPPYVVALVELEEGVRIVSNVIGCAPSAVRIGMPVKVTFEAVDDELTLPLFRPVEA